MIRFVLVLIAFLLQFAPLAQRPNTADPDALQPPPRVNPADMDAMQ
ncbi:MAG: hypothetical protein KDA17_07040 [Candidatus Saccharibacteria bacterium]|nr:hypothetical protein [Candidatus Saccharibacteria bacterium]